MVTKSFRAITLLAFIVANASWAEPLTPGPLPGISGSAWIADNAYLVVHDAKVDEDAEPPQSRVSLLRIPAEGAPICVPIAINWSALKGGIPNDLEAICPIVEKPGEFVLLESSYQREDFGRIIHLKAKLDGEHCTAEIIGFTNLPKKLKDGTVFDNVEGAQTFIRDGQTYLLLGKRGKNEKKARLAWGKLDWKDYLFRVDEDYKFDTPFKDFDVMQDKRYCGELLLLDSRIYAVSCNDPGDDGPFSSVVYHIGSINTEGPLIHLIDSGQTEIVRYPDHKVEALAPLGGDRGLWIAATDDENFRGALFRTTRP